jgi:TolB-like protein/tetratricopeptide (TPR) repeat protein
MLAELRRRNVHRIGIAYLAGAWLLVQVGETLLPVFGWAEQNLRVAVILLAIGFIPALILAWVFEWTPEGIRRETDMPVEAPRSDSKHFDRFIIAVLVIAIAYFAVDKFVFDPARDEAEIAAATEEATKRALSGTFLDEFRNRSILVLPFLNLSSDPEQAYFADGISEELLNMLARIEELRVISRSTSWSFKGREIDVAELHRKLDVSHILEGSVRKAGNQVRITAQLIDARTDTHLWSQTYERTFDDVFAIQDDISVAVADRLHLELIDPGSPHEGVDPRAYELYLRAPINPITAGIEPGERTLEVKRLLEEALAIEPDYLPAIYNLAVANWAHEEPGHRQTITDLVDRMVELAPDSSYANNWQAWIALRWHNDMVAAAPHLEKSMRYANRTDVHVWFRGAIELLHRLGRDEEAMVVAQYWLNRDPACSACLGGVANAMRIAGRHKEAALIFESLLDWREPDSTGYWSIGVAFLVAGDPEKALHYFDQIDEGNTGIDKQFARAFALHSLGRFDEFEAILADHLASRPENSVESVARLYAWSNQADEAFQWIEKDISESGEGKAVALAVKLSDLYEPIKSDPRYQALLEKYGAADEEKLNIEFKPQYPPALQRAVDALVSR